MAIQSSSPRKSPASRAGSVLRLAAMLARASVVLSRVLGRGGSTSRTIRKTSSTAARPRLLRSTGVVPVSSS